jgi:hypothetical protein
VTPPESFPGRPRGRRARHDGDAPEWQGYDATQQDQREFPDLAPIRPREARERDEHAQGGQPGRHSRPGQSSSPGGYGGYQAGGPGAPSGPVQAPWEEQPWAGPQAGQQDPAPPQHYQQQAQHAPARQRSARTKQDDAPSWAEPDSVEAFSERWHRRGLDSRDEQRAGRHRTRRRLVIAGATVVVLAIAATIYLLSGGPGAANLGFGSFVTSFLPGELQQVPDPCTAVPSATLRQYMPGTLKEAAPPLNSGANTECTWTLDSAPTYRVLEVQLQAYSPSGLASGNGSATFAAEDAFQTFENGFTSPAPKSGQPKATVTDLSGMPGGTQTSAFQATQVFTRGGATTDVANVLVRYRNVIITVVVDGLDQTSGGKKYGPVAMSDLTAEANAVAKEMASQIAK